jgi:NADH:ubiquinone oxidoreductase subunit 3 (subunit A)
LPIYSIYIMSGFLIILTVGFIYEWLMEALSWE